MNTETLLEQLENLLGISQQDADLEGKLIWILDTTKLRLKILLGGIEPPEELSYIVIEVAVIRFNRIGSEGFSSHTVEGESTVFLDNDFARYKDDIDAYLREQKDSKKGKVRFL